MSSGFITESEVSELRKKRQDEWEKVRKPDEPLERPEEPIDSRSLYERLKEQKMKKDLEYEEAHKLKNLIRGLDDDEVEFLDLVDRTKMKVEKQQQIEEQKELEDFRQRVASLQEASENKNPLELITSKSKSKLLNQTSTRPSQKSILSGSVVVRKRKNGEIPPVNASPSKQPKLTSPNGDKKEDALQKGSCSKQKENKPEEACSSNNSFTKSTGDKRKIDDSADPLAAVVESCHPLDKGALKCIGILPGIGKYKESSDSEVSTDSEEEAQVSYGKYDLVGREFQIIRKHKVRGDDDDD